MTEHDEFERTLVRWFEAEAVGPAPAGRLERAIEATRARRPLPAVAAGFGSGWSEAGRQGGAFAASWRVVLVVALLLLALLLTVLVAVIGNQPRPASGDLGVFEPVRGRVVFRVGTHLQAVDPDDPASSLVVEPGDLALLDKMMPAGWSADGSKLAMTDEYHGALYVMDQSGALKRVPIEDPGLGCCSFVTSDWLSPDGTKGLALQGLGGLHVLDLQEIGQSRVVELKPPQPATGEIQPVMPVWSPDGSHAAYIWSKGGDMAAPAVGIVDLASGATRELISGWGLIRQIVWSPDGAQILVVAGRDAPTYGTGLNPLTKAQPASLYAVDIDDAEAHEVASGHYVAAAWSPDGTRIAAFDVRRLVLINIDGSGSRRVLAQLAYDDYLFNGVVWHPVPAPEPVP